MGGSREQRREFMKVPSCGHSDVGSMRSIRGGRGQRMGCMCGGGWVEGGVCVWGICVCWVHEHFFRF